MKALEKSFAALMEEGWYSNLADSYMSIWYLSFTENKKKVHSISSNPAGLEFTYDLSNQNHKNTLHFFFKADPEKYIADPVSLIPEESREFVRKKLEEKTKN